MHTPSKKENTKKSQCENLPCFFINRERERERYTAEIRVNGKEIDTRWV